MKNLIIYIIFISLISCSNDFLELAPISQTNVQNFYKNAEDIDNAVVAAYASLKMRGQYGGFWVSQEVRSDNTGSVIGGFVTEEDEFDRFILPATNTYLNDMWYHGYIGISRTNGVLENIDKIELDEQIKNSYVGEMKFLRALMYFNLVRSFGDVPLVLRETKSAEEGYAQPRVDKDLIYDQIIKDLIEAEENLPLKTNYSNSDLGRATKGAAKSLLGKVYLTLHKYVEASKELKEVINSKQYELLDNYLDLWNPDNGNNLESIFEVQYKKGGLGVGNGFSNLFAPSSSGNDVVLGGGSGYNYPSEDMMNAYEENDMRKEISWKKGYTNSDGTFVEFPYVSKYIDSSFQINDSGSNWPILRYADVLLMYAEAINELNSGPNIEAYNAINLVRSRAGLGQLDDLNYEAFKNAIAQERRVELAFENHRWFDLVRTGKAVEVMNQYLPTIGIDITVQEHQTILPVPQTQIDVNPSLIEQNPGY